MLTGTTSVVAEAAAGRIRIDSLSGLRRGQMVTHTACDDAEVACRRVFCGEDRSIAGRVVPHAVFTDPEAGAVGLTEAQARDAGYDITVNRQGFAEARAIGSTLG